MRMEAEDRDTLTVTRFSGLVVVDRFFPSSKRCSACGFEMNEMPLSVRRWTCPACGVDQREGSSRSYPASVKPAPVKQEVSAKATLS